MANAAILLTAGKGDRMQGEVEDKILHQLNGKAAILYSLEAFISSNIIDQYYIVYRDEDQRMRLEKAMESLEVNLEYIQGGPERQDSVYNALTRLPESISHVFIHDCARPMLESAILPGLLVLAKESKAATIARRITDTIKQADKTGDELTRCQLKHIDRETLWAMETPQAFERELILSSYQQVITRKIKITDDTSAVSECGHSVSILPSTSPNPKITTPADIGYIEYLLKQR